MSAKIESMMYVREKPWRGLGKEVPEASTSADTLRFAGLDWTVRQEPVYNSRGGVIKGYKSNVRDTDGNVLGIVGDRYKVVQNTDAFNFTDDLIGGDVRYFRHAFHAPQEHEKLRGEQLGAHYGRSRDYG